MNPEENDLMPTLTDDQGKKWVILEFWSKAAGRTLYALDPADSWPGHEEE